MKTLPAAAVPQGAVVILPNGNQMAVEFVENAAPEPGRITWRDGGVVEVVIDAAIPVEIVTLP